SPSRPSAASSWPAGTGPAHFYGRPNIGDPWPGRYSIGRITPACRPHSPILHSRPALAGTGPGRRVPWRAGIETAREPEAAMSDNQITIQDAGPCRKKISIEIPASVVDGTIEDSYATVAHEATLPGF